MPRYRYCGWHTAAPTPAREYSMYIITGSMQDARDYGALPTGDKPTAQLASLGTTWASTDL